MWKMNLPCSYVSGRWSIAALDSLRSTVGLSPIEEYLKTSSESIGQEIVWDKEKTVVDFD